MASTTRQAQRSSASTDSAPSHGKVNADGAEVVRHQRRGAAQVAARGQVQPLGLRHRERSEHLDADAGVDDDVVAVVHGGEPGVGGHLDRARRQQQGVPRCERRRPQRVACPIPAPRLPGAATAACRRRRSGRRNPRGPRRRGRCVPRRVGHRCRPRRTGAPARTRSAMPGTPRRSPATRGGPATRRTRDRASRDTRGPRRPAVVRRRRSGPRPPRRRRPSARAP